MIDEDGAGPHRCEGSGWPHRDASHVIVVTDAGEHGIAIACSFSRRGRRFAAEFGAPCSALAGERL